MRILKNEEYDNLRATIKRLLDENLQLRQDNYALKREINFLRFSAGEWKDLSFPNSEVKEERRYVSPDFWNSIYKSADSDGANNF